MKKKILIKFWRNKK